MRRRHLLLATALLLVACSNKPPQGRLAFLMSKDTTRAYVLDSAFTTDLWGVPVLDPPYEPGLNQLTILRDVGTAQMAVEKTIPLGIEGWLSVFALSPDGDTAVVGRVDPDEVLVVRGLSGDAPYLAHSVPLSEKPSAVTVSPDGSWALVGSQELTQDLAPGPKGPLKLFLVAGLPARPVIVAEVDIGPDEEIDCGNVSSIRITDN
ncbi:MAG: YncE family protein, partial [Planctomycetota bacterium]